MMTLSVIIAGAEASLDDASPFRLLAHDGWGMPALVRLSDRGPLQHGDTDRGYHLRPRRGSLVIGIAETSLATMYDRRSALLGLFKPINDPTLRWQLPNGDERRIDVQLVDALSMPWRAQGWAAAKVSLDLKASDPVFYDPTLQLTQFRTESISNLSFPVAFPIGFGSSIISAGQTINYAGTFDAYPTIKFTGPMDNPSIENTTLGLKIGLSYTLAVGEVVTVDLTPGAKSITSDTAGDLIGTLTSDSDLADWRLAPDPDAPNGDNNITVVASGSTSVSLVELSWMDRFIGI